MTSANSAATLHEDRRAIETISSIDPNAIDTNLWPDFRLKINSDDEPWWDKMGIPARDEYAAALDALQSATLTDDGSFTAGGRTFYFWKEAPGQARLYWSAPDGDTYALGANDARLKDLADSDPLAAAIEMSRRFALAMTQDEDVSLPLVREMHALAVRHEYMDNQFSRSRPCLETDPWTGKMHVTGPDLPSVPTDHDSPWPYVVTAHWLLEGPQAKKMALLSRTYIETRLDDDYFPSCSRSVLIRLGAEANAILAAAGLATIPIDRISAFASQTRHKGSFELLLEHEQNPTEIADDDYDIELSYGRRLPPCEKALVDDLGTVLTVSGGIIRTVSQTYNLRPYDPEGGEPFGLHALENRKAQATNGDDGSAFDDDEDCPVMVFGPGSQFESDESTFAFFRSLPKNLVENMDPSVVAAHGNLLKIVANALVELTLVRLYETDAANEALYYPHIETRYDGTIEINIGESGHLKTGVTLQGPPMLGGLGGPGFGIQGIIASPAEGYFKDICCGLAAADMRRSAEATFARLGITDLAKLTAAVDEYGEFLDVDDEAEQSDDDLALRIPTA